ncbi:hypothetical protein GCM10010404_14190 [Nonomuraea africana]
MVTPPLPEESGFSLSRFRSVAKGKPCPEDVDRRVHVGVRNLNDLRTDLPAVLACLGTIWFLKDVLRPLDEDRTAILRAPHEVVCRARGGAHPRSHTIIMTLACVQRTENGDL